MAYPKRDTAFYTFIIAKVQGVGTHWQVTSSDGQRSIRYWKASCHPIPKVGEICRVYGRGGDDVRGIFVGGKKVFYRDSENQGRWISRRSVARPPYIVVNNPRIAKRN